MKVSNENRKSLSSDEKLAEALRFFSGMWFLIYKMLSTILDFSRDFSKFSLNLQASWEVCN